MVAKYIIFLLIVVLAVFGEARHAHPRMEQRADTTETRVVDEKNDYNAAETDVVKLKPKLSPPNSILFFKAYDPCEDGFKLDYLGICREVWF